MARQDGIPMEFFADLVATYYTTSAEGDETTGWRVKVTPPPTMGKWWEALYLVREGKAVRLLATRSARSKRAIGAHVAGLLDKGKGEAARRWLDWMADEPDVVFRAIWKKGEKADDAVVKIAAAALLIDAPTDKTIATLESCLKLDDATRKNGCTVALSSAYAARERWKDASDTLGRATAPLVTDPDVAVRRAFYLLRNGHDKAASKVLEAATAVVPILWLNVETQPLKDEEVAAIRQMATTSKFVGAASVALFLHVKHDDYADLERSVDLALSYDDTGEGGPANWYVIGRIAESLGYPQIARTAYERAATGIDVTHHLALKKLETLSPPTR